MSLVPILKSAIEDVREKPTPGNTRSVYAVTGSELDPPPLDYYERLHYERRLLLRALKLLLTGEDLLVGNGRDIAWRAIADVEREERRRACRRRFRDLSSAQKKKAGTETK